MQHNFDINKTKQNQKVPTTNISTIHLLDKANHSNSDTHFYGSTLSTSFCVPPIQFQHMKTAIIFLATILLVNIFNIVLSSHCLETALLIPQVSP